jgi:hypothetical protein
MLLHAVNGCGFFPLYISRRLLMNAPHHMMERIFVRAAGGDESLGDRHAARGLMQ